MKFALVNDQKTESQPKLKGLCPGCLQPVSAKCGEQKIWHWAHLTKKTCDSWREPETEWHRAWKDKFPREWQEYVQYDPQTGEKHIADVRTSHGLVIEFQHSHLDPQERIAREKFYGNMVWVVDGTRLKKDYLRFLKGMTNRIPTNFRWLFYVPDPKKCFPTSWLNSSVPVFFDFRGTAPSNPADNGRELLWILLPYREEKNGNAIIIAMTREEFVSQTHNSGDLLSVLASVGTFKRPATQQRYYPRHIRRRRRL